MWKKRIFSVLLTAMLILPSSAFAAENGEWLLPKIQDAPAFTDITGTICETAAGLCCETGLMTGVDAKHFMPEVGLSRAQTVALSARLHTLLRTGTLDTFQEHSQTGADWWKPYDAYLREQIPALAENQVYESMCDYPSTNCYRHEFFEILSIVLEDTETVLPEINDINAVPDCMEPNIIQFYRAGILSGKDAYGSLHAGGPLSRCAAAAMLARLIDPAQRLTLQLQPLELCQELLGIAPDTVLMWVGGQEITAGQFMPSLVSAFSYYNHSHFASMVLTGWEGDIALEEVAQMVQAEALAQELGLAFSDGDAVYYDGYHGLTAEGQAWTASRTALYEQVKAALEPETLPDLPEIQYAEIWDSLPFQDAFVQTRNLPYWGNTF
ncbi:MAG: hypothetical protein HFF89_04680 [Oscillibacter sp.]|nr:hypothetical protein [Oscillibacter sp.]MCI9375723.1 hypothetical protein [Oscillibacter sp.]